MIFFSCCKLMKFMEVNFENLELELFWQWRYCFLFIVNFTHLTLLYKFSQDTSAESTIVCELIDEAIVGLCFDIHRSIKRGAYGVLEQSDEHMFVLSWKFALYMSTW